MKGGTVQHGTHFIKMKTYTHEKGKHGVTPLWIPKVWLFKRPSRLAYRVKFDQTAEYYHTDGYAGINKLFGIDFSPITPGNFGWSYMFGWAWEGKEVAVYAYINRPDSTFEFKKLAAFSYVSAKDMEILPTENAVLFVFNRGKSDESIYIFDGGKQPAMLSREIRPYFGGICPSPKNINIGFEKI